MKFSDLLDIVIRFVNHNYLIILILATILYVLFFVIMIAKFKKVGFIEFTIFIVSLVAAGVHITVDSVGYSIYWETRQDLTLIFFAVIVYLFGLIVAFFSLIIRLARKPKEKKIKKDKKVKEIKNVKPVEIKKEENVEIIKPIVEEKVIEEPIKKPGEAYPFVSYLSRIEEAIALYNERDDSYHLSKKMQEQLQLDFNQISVKDFRTLVYDNDLVIFDEMINQKEGNNKYRYHLMINGGILEVEEDREIINDRIVSSFRLVKKENERMVIGDRRQLESDLTDLIIDGSEFGLIFVLVNNNQMLVNSLGRINTFRLLSEYFKGINKDLFASTSKIYELGNKEFCILTKNLDLYYDNLKMVKDHNSDLIEAKISFKDNNYFVTNVLGFVNFGEVKERNSTEYIEAGRLALSLALNKDLEFVEYKIDKLYDDSSEFEKLKVDLSNKFLEDL